MNKNTRIIIIIIAAVIVIAGAGLIVYRNWRTTNKKPDMPNVSVFKCHIGKTVDDSDLNEIKEIINNALNGNNVLDIKKGFPVIENLTDENGEILDIEVGDSVTVTISILNDEEKVNVFSAIIDKYGISTDFLIDFSDIYRSDYK